MVDREDVTSSTDGSASREPQSYPGERLGRPPSGPGSVAGFGRRFAAVSIDWFASLLIASAFAGRERLGLAALGVFAVENVLLLSTLRATFGMRLLGLAVDRVPSGVVSPLRVVVRTLLLCAVIPATVWDSDGRGLHDKAAGSVVVNARGAAPREGGPTGT